jgi:uncharacterized membrane protein YhiD involved in acid resistance
MDELIKSLQLDKVIRHVNLPESMTPVVSIWQLLVGIILAALLSMLISVVYRRIHSETAYSQSLVHTFVLISMVTALIMVIIGSNIARAFSLVGALSIIRFRTAIKSPLDVAFLFMAIAIGMACGTGFYGLAFVGTLAMLGLMSGLHRINFGAYPLRQEFLLSVYFHLHVAYESALEPLMDKFFIAYSIAYVETIRQGTMREVVYSVRPKDGVKDKEIIDAVTKINDNLKVSYRSIRQAVEIP